MDLGADNITGGYYIEAKFALFTAASNLHIKVETVELSLKGQQSFRYIYCALNLGSVFFLEIVFVCFVDICNSVLNLQQGSGQVKGS